MENLVSENMVSMIEEQREEFESMGESHAMTSLDTPMHNDAFKLSDAEKIDIIQENFKNIMHTLGLDLKDDSLSGTPYRVAKMYVKEIFSGLNPQNKPKITLFENRYNYGEMLIEKNITLYSACEHHFLPIVGKAHVAYISSGKVIGLSKINRLVKYFSKRPQVQERLTLQIANELCKNLDTEDVAVIVESRHLCVSSRGISDVSSTTVTAHYSGKFEEQATKNEFLTYLQNDLM